MPATNTLTSIFTAIANAIRGKNGLSTQYQPADMAAAITAIPSGGGDENATFDPTYKTYQYNTGKANNTGYFLPRSIRNIDISDYDLSNFTNLNYMFSNCNYLTNINWPQDAAKLPSRVTAVEYMYNGCTELNEVFLPPADYSNAPYLGYLFSGCSLITSITLPPTLGVAQTYSYQSECICYNCQNLKSFSAPGLKFISTDTFKNCYKLKTISIPSCTQISISNTFSSCDAIETIILPATPPTLSNANIFGKGNGVPPSNFIGFFVPDEIAVAAYQAASNWSVWANYIKPMSQLPA